MKHNIFTQSFSAKGYRFAIAVAHFNPEITKGLLKGAQQAFYNAGALEDSIHVFPVPGSFELPFIAQRIAQTKRYDAILCLGAVIKGETPHYEHVAGAASRGILEVSLKYDIPVLFGVITALNLKQAKARSGPGEMNRGAEAAFAALEILATIKTVPQHF